MQQLLISDTNVIIDLEESGLIGLLFHLPYTFAVPDILYWEELEEQHGHLLEHGLQLKELEPETMLYATQLVNRYGGPSTNDCFALALAKQESCPLVTGDMRLRKAADQERVEKLGTIWLIEEMLSHGVITLDAAETARDAMKQAGSRLPWSLFNAMLDRFR